MKFLFRAALLLALWLGAAPAFAVGLLPTTTITSAVTAATTTPFVLTAVPRNLAVEAQFVYGSGGTTADAYVQTSLDGGASWFDVADFHFTTSSGKAAFNLSAATPVTTQYTTLTDGSLAANTAKDGLLGPQYRVKYTTTGTYAGSTTLRVDVGALGN